MIEGELMQEPSPPTGLENTLDAHPVSGPATSSPDLDPDVDQGAPPRANPGLKSGLEEKTHGH